MTTNQLFRWPTFCVFYKNLFTCQDQGLLCFLRAFMANAPAVEPCAKAFDAAALSALSALVLVAFVALGFCDFAELLLVGLAFTLALLFALVVVFEEPTTVLFFVALVVVVFFIVLVAAFFVVFALGALLLLGMLLLL